MLGLDSIGIPFLYSQDMRLFSPSRRSGSFVSWVFGPFAEEVVQSSPNADSYGRSRNSEAAAWAVFVPIFFPDAHFEIISVFNISSENLSLFYLFEDNLVCCSFFSCWFGLVGDIGLVCVCSVGKN